MGDIDIVNRSINVEFTGLSNKILESLDVLVSVSNDKSIIEYVNEEPHKSLLGYTRDELIGKGLVQFIHPEDLIRGNEGIENIFKEGSGFRDLRLLHKNGNSIWFSSKGTRVTDAEGKSRIIVMSQEITAGKKIKQAMLESKERYKTLVQTMTEGFGILDENGVITYVNDRLCAMFNETRESIIGHKTLEFLDEENQKILKKELEKRKNGFEDSYELEWTRKDGKKVYSIMSPQAIHDDSGLYKGNFAVITDISELTSVYNHLKESEERFRDIAELLPDIVYEADERGKISFLNKIGFEKFGYDDDEVIGKISIIKAVVPEQRKRILENAKRFLEGQVVEAGEYLFQRRDGSKFYGRVHSRPIVKKGKVIGIRGVIHDIHEKKLAEQKLIESENKFRTLYEHIPCGTMITGDDYLIKDVNEITCKITGYKKEELIGKSCGVLCPKGSGAERCPIWKLGHTEFEGMNTYITCKDGTKKPIIKNAKRIEIEGKTHILEIIQDTSKSKELEAKLTASEAKYRVLFESNPYGIWIVNMSGIIIDCNDSFNQFLSIYTKEDMIGKKYTEALGLFERPGHFVPMFKGRLRTLLKQGYLDPIEFQISKANGESLWVALQSTLFLLDGNTHIQVLIKDITVRKEAQLLLEASEEKYRHLFESSPYIIILTDLEGRLIDYNSKCSQTFFDEIDFEAKGKDFKELLPQILKVTPELMKLNEKRVNGLAHGSAPPVLEIELEKLSGKKYWFNVISTLVKVEESDVIQIIIQDITAKKKAELELKTSQQELQELNKELEQIVSERTSELRESERKLIKQNVELKKLDEIKNDFITIAAHELKTPLISISGYIEYIQTKYEDNLNLEMIEDMSVVQRNIKRLNNYMNQLLDVMKIDADKLKLNLEPVDLIEIINECVDELSYLIKEKNHELYLELDDKIILNVDRERVFQVFSNLLSNAVKFTSNNGKIEIKVKREGNQIITTIKDTGVGLTSEEMNKIFKKFEMVAPRNMDEYGTSKGTGLGLYISKGIIEAHHGTIQAVSKGRNEGTTLIFSLPTRNLI